MGGACCLALNCCGEYCTPLCLSITSVVLTTISIGLSICIIVVTPWGDEELKLPGKLIFFKRSDWRLLFLFYWEF